MSAETKVIKHKFSVLEFAEALGNVSATCRQKGVSRTHFYKYKRQFQTHGWKAGEEIYPR